jgi:hypothetical protein
MLGNNTSDINKPISNATQQAINVLRLEGNLNTYKRSLLQLVDKTRNAKVSFSNCNRIDGAEYEGEVRHIDKNNLAILFPLLKRNSNI